MGYDNEYANNLSPIVLDIETAPLANAREFIEAPDLSDVKAPANYKDPVKIAAYIEEAKADKAADFEKNVTDKSALDFNLARVVAIAWWKDGLTSVRSNFEDGGEAESIAEFWDVCRQRTIVGFRIREFDLPMLIQRSRYLGIRHPHLDLGRYARGSRIVDLYDLLTFQDLRGENVMRRTAKSFARRFGIPVNDPIDGKQIPALVAAGAWEQVESHVIADVAMEVALAELLGVVPARVPAEVL